MQQDRFKLIAAVFFMLIRDGKVLLSRRKDTGWEDEKYSLPGGHFNGNETANMVTVREAKEELGIVIRPEDVKFFNVSHMNTTDERLQFSFVVEKWQGEPKNMEPEKASEIGWFPINNLPDDTNDQTKATIGWHKNGVAYTEFGWEK